jgi:hypothetical protein
MSSAGSWESSALERHCSHCSGEAPGEVYPGRDYLSALQRLKGDEAEWQAHKVEPFFWSDAEMMHVRVCGDCAKCLGLGQAEAAHATLTLRPQLNKEKVG